MIDRSKSFEIEGAKREEIAKKFNLLRAYLNLNKIR